MIHFKEQEKFAKIPSLREFQPSKLFVEFVNFNKLFEVVEYVQLQVGFFQCHYTVVVYSCPIGHQHILIKSEYRQS